MLNRPTLNCYKFRTTSDRKILIVPLINIFVVKLKTTIEMKTNNQLDMFPKFIIDW